MADDMMRHLFPCDFDPPDCYILTNKVRRRCSLVVYDGDGKRTPNVRVASVAVRLWDGNFDDLFIGSVEI